MGKTRSPNYDNGRNSLKVNLKKDLEIKIANYNKNFIPTSEKCT
jgi:hypothetical protein